MNRELRDLIRSWPDCDYWDTDETVRVLTHDDVLSALEDAISNLSDASDKRPLEVQIREAWPESLTIYGWRRHELTQEEIKKIAIHATEAALDYFRDTLELGNPDDDDAEPHRSLPELFEKALTEDMGTRFIWNCDQTDSIKLTTDQIVALARSEWKEWFEENT